MSETVTFTGQDIIDAIEKNGLVHNHNGWFEEDEFGRITSACVMGQAAINLGIDISDFWNGHTVGDLKIAINEMIDLNDELPNSGRPRAYSDLKKAARRVFKPFRNQTFKVKAKEYSVVRKGE